MTKYPEPPVDDRRATPELRRIAREFFAAKNRHNPDELQAFFSDGMDSYCDGTLGWVVEGRHAVHETFSGIMPNWGDGRSYPTRVLGSVDSAVIVLSDTPELFGGEIHAISAVELSHGKITRWADYWDSSAFPSDVFDRLAKTGADAPERLGRQRASPGPGIGGAVERLHAVLGGVEGAENPFTFDAVWEDLALRTRVVGAAAIGRMLDRSRRQLPFGVGVEIANVLGGAAGGGFEWLAPAQATVRVGILAIEIDDAARISRVTACYDGRRLPAAQFRDLVDASHDRSI